MIGLSAAAAILAGLCLAAGGVLQQRSASLRPSDERMSPKLLLTLAKDRTWLIGMGLAVLSYGFQAVALTYGPLTLVQPLVVSELLFSVPISMRLRNLRLRWQDWLSVGAVVAGLALGMVASHPHPGNPIQPIMVWLPALGGAFVLVSLALLVAKRVEGPPKATLFALAGAITMGMQSALYDATIAILRTQTWHVVIHWETYALILASVAGMFLIQNAFQAGPLAASTPMIDSLLPLVAIAIGVGLFHESIRTSVFGLGGAAGGLVLLLIGIVALDTSPVVLKQHRLEEEERKTAKQEA